LISCRCKSGQFFFTMYVTHKGDPIGVVFALLCLACWGSWSTTLVLAGDTMKFELYYFDFAISFLLTGIVVGLIIGALPGDDVNYINQLFSHGGSCYVWSASAGVMWNMANVLLCKGIGLMGQAIGFPLCVGLGLISGTVVNYVLTPAGTNMGLLIAGCSLALVGVLTVGRLASVKDAEMAEIATSSPPLADEDQTKTESASLTRKMAICLLGGFLLGFNNIGVMYATRGAGNMTATEAEVGCQLSPPGNQTFFSIGVFISSAILIPLSVSFPLEGHKATTTMREIFSGYKDVRVKDHMLACLGGFLLCCGFFCYNLGNPALGPAPTYSIGQSAPVVGILWGTFFFKEFKGTSAKVWGHIPIIVMLFAGAIVCLALSSG